MEEHSTLSTLGGSESALFEQAKAFIREWYEQHRDARLVFHNFHFAFDLVARAQEICTAVEAGPELRENVLLAAWFLPTGFLMQYRQPYPGSAENARLFLQDRGFSPDRLEEILKSMRAVLETRPAQTEATRLLADAYQVTAYIDDYNNRHLLLRMEQEMMLGQRWTKAEWASRQWQTLLQIRLNTPYARLRYEPALAQHMLFQKERVEKEMHRAEEAEATAADLPTKPFQGLETGVPQRGIQTFFRTNYRNHINLSSIADNKANIMISVNTIMISVLITFLSYRNIAETKPMILLPVVIFLVTGLASLIFAILSSRPKVTMLNPRHTPPETIRKNIVFFGNFVTLDLDQYEQAMDAMFRDGELLIGNLTRDLYYLGKVLEKKYRYLSISYNIFMVGFVATVGTFLYALFS